MNEKEVGKMEKYKMLKDEITRMWGMIKVIVIPVVVGALDAISTTLSILQQLGFR